jgi:polyhydroxybutyrate depolymerase
MTSLRGAASAFFLVFLGCTGGGEGSGGAGNPDDVDQGQDPSLADDSGTVSPAEPDAAPEAPVETPERDASVSEPPPPTSTGPGDWGPGDYPPNLGAQEYLELTGIPGQGDKVRGYKVHVPPSYQANVPTPVVFALHALHMDAVLFAVNGTGIIPKSDKEGFIVVMPNGLQEDGFGGSWNAGTCCGKAGEQQLDDVAFVRTVFAEVGKHLNVDLTRVYALGLSNGAHLTHRLACEASDIFAAIAPLAGGICTKELSPEPGNEATTFTECKPPYPVPVLTMHGTKDTFVPYESMERTLDYWAMQNGCSATTKPALMPVSGGDTTCVTYEGCPDGVEVTGCTVAEGGHCWFGDSTCGTGAPIIGNLVVGNNSDTLVATDAAWAFVSKFVRRH